ncbi:hypothetical protein BDN72DRAFT_863556 [Pluteus cervinus]|uniref:Uncharacterized protein n=1 Tax=Pluteus cervinus TaxID=181527 RepID=A0ACD3A7X5_9AGAR|nr:hypothetical protein BDN72DRAFT_863556 [Pluteus cervinus]
MCSFGHSERHIMSPIRRGTSIYGPVATNHNIQPISPDTIPMLFPVGACAGVILEEAWTRWAKEHIQALNDLHNTKWAHIHLSNSSRPPSSPEKSGRRSCQCIKNLAENCNIGWMIVKTFQREANFLSAKVDLSYHEGDVVTNVGWEGTTGGSGQVVAAASVGGQPTVVASGENMVECIQNEAKQNWAYMRGTQCIFVQ